MNKKKCHALALTLLGLVSYGGTDLALSTGVIAAPQAAPVSANRTVSTVRTAMPVGNGGVLRTSSETHHYGRRRTRRYSRRKRTTQTAKVTAPEKKTEDTKIVPTNTITGIAVVPDEATVRITLEGSERFTPELATMNSGATPATLIRVPGILADAKGVGSVSVRKNGVWSVRYANQGNGTVQFVANTATPLVADTQSTPDGKRWVIVLHRAGTVPTQVAMGGKSGAFKGYPVLTAEKAADKSATAANVVFKAAVDSAVKSAINETNGAIAGPPASVKPVVINLPGGKTAEAKTKAPDTKTAEVKPADTKAAEVKPVVAKPSPSAPKPAPSLVNTPKQTQIPVAAAKDVSLVSPTKVVAPVFVAAPQGGTLAVPGTGEDRRVSLDVVAADINDVIKALALQSGINVVTSTEVKGNITVSLKRVPMIEALDTITRLSGYQYARLNSGYIVGSPASVAALIAAGRNVPMVTDYIRYRYISTEDLYAALNSKFPGLQLPTTGGGNANPAQSKLLVLTDTRERIEQVRAFVEALDQNVSEPTVTQTTELYKVKAASASDLIRLTSQLVPSVIIQIGAAQAFQSGSTGQSASFAASGSFGPTQSGGSGTTSGGSGGANTAATSGGGGGATGGAGLNAPNTLVLTGTPADIARARQILERIDVRTTQISYEARVVDVNLDVVQQLGLRYDLGQSVRIGEKTETDGGTIGPTGSISNAGNLGFGAILRSPYSIGVTLDALGTNNKARTLSSPNLSALDGQPATAFIGDQIKYVIAVQQTQQGQTIQTETATVGITLKVTGKASPDGYITLYIHPEISSVTSFLTPANSGISLPQISTRYVDTTVRVKSGETIAIGGLIREQDVVNLTKVPIIGDIPFFGQLFRRSEKRKNRSEIVVFVTARANDDGT